MNGLGDLAVKIFADSADLPAIRTMAARPFIKGFTTNPSLMRKAGVSDYKRFALEVLPLVSGRPISFETFADEFEAMERQAREIASWADNVYVKVPVTNTLGEFAGPLLRRLSEAGVKVNVTAVFTLEQVKATMEYLQGGTPAIVSVFAGRIADTGVDPAPMMREARKLLQASPATELLWASCREVLNVVQADAAGCHIITVMDDVVKKLALLGKDHDEYSLETVRMFFDDAAAAGYAIPETMDISGGPRS